MAITLNNLRKIWPFDSTKIIEIRYYHQRETKKFIKSYFKKRQIRVNCISSSMQREEKGRLYDKTYELKVPQSVNYSQMIEDLSLYHNVMKVRQV